MPASATWTCGCGTDVAAAERCPTCGWAQAAPGQPDRSPRRWVPVVSAVLVATLAVDGVAVLRGLGETSAHRVREDRVEAAPFVPTDVVDDLTARTVPDDLGALLPADLAGWERLDVPGVTGPLTLEELTEGMWEGTALDVWRDQLRSIGFVRAHAVVFVAGDRLVGATVWEFEGPSGARQTIEDQGTLATVDGSVTQLDSTLVDDGVAFTYPDGDQHALELWYAVDQLLINEYVVAPGSVGDADLQGFHDAITTLVGP